MSAKRRSWRRTRKAEQVDEEEEEVKEERADTTTYNHCICMTLQHHCSSPSSDSITIPTLTSISFHAPDDAVSAVGSMEIYQARTTPASFSSSASPSVTISASQSRTRSYS